MTSPAISKWIRGQQRSRIDQGLPLYEHAELLPTIRRLESSEEISQLQRVRKQLGQQPLTEEDLEPVGFLEALGERGVSGYIPFVGGGVEALDLTGVYLMAERIKDGTGTEDDEHELMDWWLDQQLRATRGTSWGGTVGEIASQLPAFAGEFVLTGGAFTAGRKVGIKAAKKLIGESVEKTAKKSAANLAARAATSVSGGVAGAVSQATIGGVLTSRWAGDTLRDMMPNMGLTEDEYGQLGMLVEESDMHLGNAIFRGWASQVREFGSERLGWMIGKKGIGRMLKNTPVDEQVKGWRAAVAKKWMTGKAGRTVDQLATLKKKIGWHGIIGEMFEERAGELIDVPIDAMTLGELNYAFPGWEHLSAEAVAFALPGAGFAALNRRGIKKQQRKVGESVIKERAKLLDLGKPAETVEAAEAPDVVDEPEWLQDIAVDIEPTSEDAIDGDAPSGRAVFKDAEGTVYGELPYESGEAANVRGRMAGLLAESEAPEGVVVEYIDEVQELQPVEAEAEAVEEELQPGEQMVMFSPATENVSEETEVADVSEVPRRAREVIQPDLESAAAAATSLTGVEHSARAVPKREQGRGMRMLAAGLRATGLRLVPIDVQSTEDGASAQFAGFASNRDSRVIYVQNSGENAIRNSVLGLVSHEATHALESENPDLFNYLVSLAPVEVAEGIQQYSKTNLGAGVFGREGAGPDISVQEGMATAVQEAITRIGNIEGVTDQAERSLLERLADWFRGTATRLGLKGKFAREMQGVVEQMVAGKDIAEIELPRQARGLERARARGLAPRAGAVAPAVEADAAPRFAPAPAEREVTWTDSEQQQFDWLGKEYYDGNSFVPLLASPYVFKRQDQTKPEQEWFDGLFTGRLGDNIDAHQNGVYRQPDGSVEIHNKGLFFGLLEAYRGAEGRTPPSFADPSAGRNFERLEGLLQQEFEGFVSPETTPRFAPAPMSADAQARANLVSARDVVPTGGKNNNIVLVRDIGLAINGVKNDYENDAAFESAVLRGIEAFNYQMQQDESGLNWYSEVIAEAYEITSAVYPELRDDPVKRAVFAAFVAPLSNNIKARENWDHASHAYGTWKETGKIPRTNVNGNMFGARGNTIATQLGLLEHMLNTMGERGLVDFLTSPHTLKELRDVRRSSAQDESLRDERFPKANGAMYKVTPSMALKGKAKDEYLGGYIFGEKIGPFFLNIFGLDETTIDVWAHRQFTREFGELLSTPSKETGLNDAPTSRTRPHAKRYFEEIGKRTGFKPQEAQAVLWYFEQQLYNSLGVKTESTDFVDGANLFVNTPGVAVGGRAVEQGVAGTRFAPAPGGARAVKPQVRRATNQVKSPDLRKLDEKFTQQARGARAGYTAGREAGYRHAKDIAEDQIKRLKAKPKDVKRIKADVKKYFDRIFKGRNMELVGLREIKSLLSAMQKAETPKSLGKALQKILDVSLRLRSKEARRDAKKLFRTVRKARQKGLPSEFGDRLDKGVAAVEVLASAEQPKNNNLLNQQTNELVKKIGELNEVLAEAKSEKNEIKALRRMTEAAAIASILNEIKEGKDPISDVAAWGGRKAQVEGNTLSTVGRWHQDITSLTQRITGKVDNQSDLYALLVTNFREAEDNYNAQLRDVMNKMNEAAIEAGFRSFEDAMGRMSGSHGMALVEMVELDLPSVDGRVSLTPAEAMHLMLMDPMTRSLIDGGVELSLKRSKGGQGRVVLTSADLEAVEQQLDPKIVKFAETMKEVLETDIKPGMFAAVRKLKGSEPESVPDYWPRSRDRDQKNELKVEAFLDGTGSMGQLTEIYLENVGATKTRQQDKSSAIFVTSAMETFVEHVDMGLRVANFAEPIRIGDKSLRNDDVREELIQRHGIQTYKMLREYVATASGLRETFRGGIDRTVGAAQSNVAVSYLSMNPRTWLVQLTAIPRFVTHFSVADITAGLGWMLSNFGSLREIMREESAYFWRRWSRSSAERFGPQKYGEIVPFDREGFWRGVGNVMTNLKGMDLRGAYRSWSSAVDAIQILDGFDSMVAGVAYGAAQSKLRREGVSGANLKAEAASLAADAMRDTQNSTSTLDLTMGALAGRQSPLARLFLMFSSDPLKTTNILIQGGRLMKQGQKARGAEMIAGVIASSILATTLRVGWYAGMGAIVAAIGGDDDDKKKADRAAQTWENVNRGLVRELAGLTFFGPAVEGAVNIIKGEGTGNAMDSPLTSLAGQALGATSGLAKAYANLGDAEQEQVLSKLVSAHVKWVNEVASLTVGNPIRPWVNDVRKLGEAAVFQDPVRQVRGLVRYYRDMPKQELTAEQRRYFMQAQGSLKQIDKLGRIISQQRKVYEKALESGQDGRIERARNVMQRSLDRRAELAAKALGKISPSGGG